jgi:hypothetical protein
MRKRLTALAVIGVVGMASAVSARDFEKGMNAYNSNDLATALKECRFPAERGHAEAQRNLALMYKTARGVNQDYKEAFTWFLKAAAQVNVTGISN